MQDKKLCVPKIKFEYAEVLDMLCAENHPDFISKEKISALIEALPGWDLLWNQHGFPILNKVVQSFDRGFLDNELIVSFTLRPDIFAISHPLIINGHPFFEEPSHR